MKNTPKEIQLGRILMEHRRKRGITQEELAAYMGVSKASVSKWETSTTYPDITLLPQLAAFFDISIDTLMGYEPQMTNEEIRRLYSMLSRDFSIKPFQEVVSRCRDLTKKYFSCMPLLFQMGSLYLNHCVLADTKEQTEALIEEALVLFVRVKEESRNLELASQAVHMEALCLLQLGRPQETLELLSACEIVKITPEPLLARAWEMLGNPKEAKSILQAGIYHTMLELLNLMLPYQELCADHPAAYEESYRRIEAISHIFQLDALHPGIRMTICHSCARGFLRQGDRETALTILEKYTALAACDAAQMRLHGDDYFDLLDHWLEKNLILGNDLPRDETLIRNSMLQAVADDPDFMQLMEDERFRMLLHKLKAAVNTTRCGEN